MASIDALKKELEVYERMRGKLLEKYRGKVVVIKDGKLIGVYDNEEEAFRDVVEKYGLVSVLIKRVTEKEKPEEIPSYTYGLLGVVLTD